MKSSIQQYLDWLKNYEPFMYAVVSQKVMESGQSLSGLGFWASIGSAFSTIGNAVVQAAPAYVQYKQSRDASKLAKAQLELQKKQLQTQTAQPAPRVQPDPPLPQPNKNALQEILERLKLAQSNQPQPPPSPQYVPYVNPQQMTPAQYNRAITATTQGMSWLNDPKLLIPIGVGLITILFIRRRR